MWEDSDEPLLLVSFTMPGVLEGRTVDSASVSFEADCSGDERAVSHQASAVTEDRDAQTVSWGCSWDTPGGDSDKGFSAYWVGGTGEGKSVCLDVT